jgi:hypothetical protein
VLHRVRDLSAENCHAVEALLGHPVSDDEAVSIKSFDPSTIFPPALSAEERIAALNSLNERLAGPIVNQREEDAAGRRGDALEPS